MSHQQEGLKMAKAIRAFYGYDSQGRMIETAQRSDGAWFFRAYEFNGYGEGWTKWSLYDEEPSITEDGSTFAWGFSRLQIETGPLRLRLPN